MSYPEMAADVVSHMDAHSIDRASLVGHSLGGKVAAAIALLYPCRVESLVLLDIAPVAYDGANAERRIWGDLSSQLVRLLAETPLDQLRERRAVEAYIDETAAQRGFPKWFKAFALTNLVRDATSGQLSWRANIAAIEESADVLRGFDMGPLGVERCFGGPTLFVRGSRSQYVPLVHEADGEVSRQFPCHSITTLEGAGHFLHTEKPQGLVDVVHSFLGRLDGDNMERR